MKNIFSLKSKVVALVALTATLLMPMASKAADIPLPVHLLTSTATVGASSTNTFSGFASSILTFSAVPNNNDTVTIGGQVYTFHGTVTNVNGDVLLVTNLAQNISNLVAGINASATGFGTWYASNMVANAFVTAVAGTTNITITAINAGPDGNRIGIGTTSANAAWPVQTITLSGGNLPLSRFVPIQGFGLSITFHGTNPSATTTVPFSVAIGIYSNYLANTGPGLISVSGAANGTTPVTIFTNIPASTAGNSRWIELVKAANTISSNLLTIDDVSVSTTPSN